MKTLKLFNNKFQYRIFLFVVFLLFSSLGGLAQNITINGIVRIRSVIMVERETQKGIIIGHKGTAIKRVGAEARKDLEKFFQKKVFIELYVKVNKNWRSDKNQLKRFGYNQN